MSNSLDPWRVMQAGTYVTDMAVPDSRYSHPFYGYGYPQGWANPPSAGDGWQRGVFVGGVGWDDVAVGDFWSDVGGVLKSLKGPIAAAAGAAAAEYGGPAAGQAASQIAGSLIDAAPGGAHPATQAAAQHTVATAKQVAKTNATINVALTAAHHAVSQASTAVVGQTPASAPSGSLPATVQKYLPAAIKAFKGSGLFGGSSSDGSSDGSSSMFSSASSSFGGGASYGASDDTSSSGDVTIGSFWDDVKNAFLTVTLIKPTNQFIKDNHLEGVVQTAAGVVASIYGGPAAGAAASSLAPMMMSVGVDDKKKSATAQKNVQKVTAAAAAHSPAMSQAVDVAKEAVKGTAASYHIHHLLQSAKMGDAQSQAALAQIQQNAAAGDPQSQAALQAINSIHQQQVQAPAAAAPAPATSGDPTQQPPAQGHHALVHRIHHLLKKAKTGDPQAQAELTKIESAAQAGDPKAQKIAHIVDVVHQHQEAQAQTQQPPPTPGVSGWYDIVGCPY